MGLDKVTDIATAMGRAAGVGEAMLAGASLGWPVNGGDLQGDIVSGGSRDPTKEKGE